MKVQILGSGCPKCKLLEQHTREAVDQLGIDAVVEKVTDTDAIMDMGVMMTPALAIDGIVKSVGKVLTKDQVSVFLTAARTGGTVLTPSAGNSPLLRGGR